MRVSTKNSRVLPRHGYADVDVTVRDSQGFVLHYELNDAPVAAVNDAITSMFASSRAAPVEAPLGGLLA